MSCSILNCGSSNWEEKIYLKVAPPDYKGETIEIKEDTVWDGEDWANNTSASNADSLGARTIPTGIYVADNDNKNKFFTVQEINGKHNRDSGFWDDTPSVVRIKAIVATLTCAIPIYALGTMFINILRIPISLISAIKHIFNKTIEAYKEHGFFDALSTLVRRSIVDITNVIVGSMISIVRVPFYAIALQLAALYTILCPYEGRQIVADIERSWHYPCTVADDIAHDRNCQINSFDDFQTMLNNKVHFLFFCFQPTGGYAHEQYSDGQPKYISLERV